MTSHSDFDLDAARARMVDEQLSAVRDPRVLDAMRRVPRHLFVPEQLRAEAYDATPLPIGLGQTISQPLIVAMMLEAAELDRRQRVLEVGTGSGYQAALLSLLAGEVYSVEIIPELAELARRNLARARIERVHVITADGSLGWPAHAPYDAILVAAAAPEVPRALVAQLAIGGRMVLPVGPVAVQVLTGVHRTAEGLEEEKLELCRFVPLVGAQGVQLPSRSRQ